MTRIIAGLWGGRRLSTPRGEGTRPTTDRVREALFSRLEALTDLEGARVLDLYAGSGALGLEALSRGAARLCAVESHRATAAVIERNARELGCADRVQVRAAKVDSVLRQPPEEPFDVVLADPPYPLSEQDLAVILELLVTQEWLAENAVIVVERSSRSPQPTWPIGLRALRSRSYGETAIHLAEPDPSAHGTIEE